MAKYVLKLRQDNNIPSRMTNLNWDLADAYPGFLIQLRVNHVVLSTQFQSLHTTNTTSHEFFYMEAGNFLSHWGVYRFLVSILSHQQVPLHPNGQILCPGGLHLVRPNVTESSEPIYFLDRLADGVSRQVWWINNDPRNRYLKFVPIAMDLEILKFHQFHPVDDVIILDDQLLGAYTSNVVSPEPEPVPVPVKAVLEEIILDSYPDKGCPICLEDLCVEQRASRMPCSHLFHSECIASWLEEAPSCPLCRAPAPLSSPI